ncbi:hypothetical protein H3N56_02990 [Cetobacterium sp. 2A]|uniref:hypothetical protein n=1 Tax=Cetobacterium sp. 2A TaxID=2754723 RepID=UPI00163D02A4|nr:hypothetical protein [Cetobacterium sp. 2A]MBC2855460.1 hypothetical protein [Cetobacterium sp. 2A]
MKKIIMLLILFSNVIFANYKVKTLNKEIIPNIKYSIDFEIPIVNGKFPTEKQMQSIALKEKKDNPGYENYFISFLLPGMELNNGYFATAVSINNNNSDMVPEILLYMLFGTEYQKYLKEDKNGAFYLENIK